IMSPEIRRAVAADAPAVRELTRAAYAKWVPLIGREPKPMTADYNAAVRNHLVDLLQFGEQLVGLVEMIPEVGYLLIENVAVAPASQGQGYRWTRKASTSAPVFGQLRIRHLQLTNRYQSDK